MTIRQKTAGKAAIALSFIAFISLGMPDGLLGVAWPGIRDTFSLPLDALGLLLLFSTAGYMASSFFSGFLVRRYGIGGLLGLSCSLTAAALMIYFLSPLWYLLLPAVFLGGVGAGAIDAGINTYVEKHYSERMMQWLHASFGVGVTLGPLVMTAGIALTGQWRPGYLIVSLAQFALAIVFFTSLHSWQKDEPADQAREHREKDAAIGETLRQLRALLSMLMFFIYTGVELGLGLWSYSLLTISRGVRPEIAGLVTGSYWAMFTVGRILAGWYTRKMSVRTILYSSIGLALAGTVLVALNPGIWLTIAGIGIIGFAIAPVFPSLISDTGNRVGIRHVSNTIGMQISAAGFGAAVVPSLAGVLARIYGLEVIPLYMMAALALLFLSILISRGHKA
ncbi:MFS transporter [Spirochaeta isovalerica]|uniref:Fucose permease n=1 Tax=Spirochaeta isovalerica TaxID=150 RepID=A0A841R6V4_9SPIO|nr:MFS transporter [Spirochaeta isovalerica]MBB6480944.1 fucose permease [Spirochaeta isovalerica]